MFKVSQNQQKNTSGLVFKVFVVELKVVDLRGSSEGDRLQDPTFRRSQNEAHRTKIELEY
jgi:hypothetical protein